jgi:hypothetical protein
MGVFPVIQIENNIKATHNNGIRITGKLKRGAQKELLPIDFTDHSTRFK